MLTKKYIKLRAVDDCNISYSYNYSLMTSIYRALTLEDSSFSKVLHEDGYMVEDKKFKLFNFNLEFLNVDFDSDSIKIYKTSEVTFMLSGEDFIINKIIKGFIKVGTVKINDSEFEIVGVKHDKKIHFTKTMAFKATSPIVESIYSEERKGAEYLNPYNPRFYTALEQNLKRKYKAVFKKECTASIEFEIDNILFVKQKLIKDIKGNGFIIGFGNLDIFIHSEDTRALEVAYYLGIGQNSSLGLGSLAYLYGEDDCSE